MEALQHLEKNRITVEEEPESLKVKALGIGGHVGFPEGSIHALYVLTEALQDLEFFQEEMCIRDRWERLWDILI